VNSGQNSVAILPWRMLVRPVVSWLDLSEKHAFMHALLWQWLLISSAEIVALPAMQKLSSTQDASATLALRALGILLGFIPLTLLLNGAFASLSWLFFRFIGIPRTFWQFLNWTAFGMLPFTLGALAGRISLELMHPVGLPHSILASLQFRGISLGIASWFPQSLQVLEFGWVFLSYVDLFGIWSFVLLCLGLRHYLRTSLHESLLGSLCLLLLSFVLLTALWQLLQQLAGTA
jgi:hypothetical protein